MENPLSNSQIDENMEVGRPVAPGLLGTNAMLTQGRGKIGPVSLPYWPTRVSSEQARTLGKKGWRIRRFHASLTSCADKLKGLSSKLGTESRKRGDGVRSISRGGPMLVMFAILGVLVGGCGTLSTSLVNESSMLASHAPISAPVETSTDALAISTDTSESPVALPVASDVAPVVITYEPITGQNAPDWVVALSGPADTSLRGTPDPVPPDPEVEEYDPWEKFNEKMFKFNYNFDRYLLKPVAKAGAQTLKLLEEDQLGIVMFQGVGDIMAHIADPRRPIGSLK